MSNVAYIARDMAGTKQHGNFADHAQATIDAVHAKDISLNLKPTDVESYARRGNDLHITLANGEVLILSGFFDVRSSGGTNLFLSSEGEFTEVVLEDRADGMLFAAYEPLDLTGKWSAYDEMVFLELDRIEPVVAPLAAPLLGGFGAAGVAAAGVAGTAALLNNDDNGGGGGGSSGVRAPTVNDPDATYPVAGSTNTPVEISGTGEPGSEVTVTIGDKTGTTTIDDDGNWVVSFDVDDLPDDGTYDTTVHVKDPEGTEYDLDGPTVDIDTTPPEAEATSGTQSTGDIVNAAEQADGPVITGTGEPGATVTLEIDGASQTTTVGDDGTWSVTFAPDEIATGEYETAITITTTDAFGNSSTSTDVLDVDTLPPPIGIDTVEGDDHINYVEAGDGVTLTGTGEAGASIDVTFQGITRSTTVGTDGSWSVDYASDEIAEGIYSTDISVTSADTAGNTSTSSHTVQVDTETTVTINTKVGDDYTINAAEQAAGVTLTGTAEPNASVVVTLEGVSTTVLADASGSWSADFASDGIPTGTYHADVSAVATDPGGNVSSISTYIAVDTETTAALDAVQAGDNVINADEQSSGVSITGTAEAGATVEVTLEGTTKTVTAASDGTWSAAFATGEIPEGQYDAAVSVTATDAAGNSESTSGTVRVDTTTTVSLDTPQAGDGTINGDEAANGVDLTGTAEAGASVTVVLGTVSKTVTADSSGNWAATFDSADIPEGTYDADISVTATDAHGNTASTSGTVAVDTTTWASIDAGQAGGDDIVNEAEAQAGVTLTGAAEPGAAVEVTVAGVTRTATVNADGTWAATFEAGALAAGEYDTAVTVTATDPAGNTASASHALRVDTVAGTVTLSPDPIALDDVINAVERDGGVEISGTATPGLTVTVGLGSASTQVVADADGNWSTTFPKADIPTGVDTLPVTASIVDDAGNTASASDTVALDTLVDPLTLNDGDVEGDGLINEDEASDGVEVTGTVEPGSQVVVEMNGVSRTATVDSAGNWSASFAAADIAAGTYDAPVTVTATDAAGNVDTVTGSVAVDTEVSPFTVEADQTDDDILNLAEHGSGLTLQGTVEPGSTVEVTLAGVTHVATVDASGNWSADFASSEIPEGTYTARATIAATDVNGNTSTITEDFDVDTEYTTPVIEKVRFDGQDVDLINTEDADGTFTVNAIDGGGNVSEPANTWFESDILGNGFLFDTPVPDGTDLIVNNSDAAGNASSTLLVLEDNATTASTLDHAALNQFNIEELNLDYANNVSLTLTEADIKALSGNSDTVTIHGGADDTISVSQATLSGTQDVNGETYNVYTVGDDGTTLVIDQNVNVVI